MEKETNIYLLLLTESKEGAQNFCAPSLLSVKRCK